MLLPEHCLLISLKHKTWLVICVIVAAFWLGGMKLLKVLFDPRMQSAVKTPCSLVQLSVNPTAACLFSVVKENRSYSTPAYLTLFPS